ncbi:tetratricopeptide repeat protein [uncultured Desulfosarcina sp.]|uniref:tetratricopeptide repeat protein n=1 Tax=uncultured Desulfosarcina sp. TaxID=218289 RepID=UPI0029C903F7|nr:tetratricopeptide repeat protein [uncultured Desulfosarcina sp.]
MDLLSTSAANADLMFSATIQQQSQLDELSSRALTKGIDLYMDKHYKEAAREFQRAVGLSPQGQYSSDASNYLANAYLKQGKTEKAIDAYQQSVDLNPFRDDTHLTLGNLYFSLGRPKDAEKEYKAAVKLNPTSAKNNYSLGQAYLELEQYSSAENQFNVVKRLAPESGSGEFGIGLVRSREQRYEDAIQSFKTAIGKKSDFYDAYAEMGYAHADLGEMDQAKEIVDFLDKNSSSLADSLSSYMYEVDPPKFSLAYSTNFFKSKPMNTTVASMDAYLANPNASKTFTMKFVFDKEMDRESVENILNWGIGRSTGSGPGEMYNFGLPVADTEIMPPNYPDHVFYDAKAQTAVVTFSLTQNAAANGTIDPSHIEFTFTGKDAFGHKMNPSGDQFRGFDGVA